MSKKQTKAQNFEAKLASAAMNGLSDAAIADIMSIPRSTVATWLKATEGSQHWRMRLIIVGARAHRQEATLKEAYDMAGDNPTLMRALIERGDRIIESGGTASEARVTVSLDGLAAKLAELGGEE